MGRPGDIAARYAVVTHLSAAFQKKTPERPKLMTSLGRPGFRYRARKGTDGVRLERNAPYSGSVGSRPSRGAPVPDEPMNSFRPSRNVRSRPFALFVPSLAW